MEYPDFQRESVQIIDKLREIRKYLSRDKCETQLLELEACMEEPTFWNNQAAAQKVTKQINPLRKKIKLDNDLLEGAEELETYLLLLAEDFSDSLLAEGAGSLSILRKLAESAEMELLLSDKLDACDAILSIHPGAGGTESQDWAEMLYRMYMRFAEKSKFSYTTDDLQPGDEAGIKSVTMEIGGENAYGKLKGESGVHRLVRISPFNAQGKRQTSFASVHVFPVLDDEIEIEILPGDLRIDTYRASGAGGQHVNKTDSAVRITHLPTNIVAQCQNERSQMKNKDTAMKILKSRLYQHYEEARQVERDKIQGEKSEIGWGSQIRSYVFHPYQMIKDHRNSYETGNISAVMDGDISGFIHAYLRHKAEQKAKKLAIKQLLKE